MKNILENLIDAFNSRKESDSPSVMRINIIKLKAEISNVILKARDVGNVVGVYSPALGEGMLLLGIEDVLTDRSEPVIVFKRYDLNGIVLQRTHIGLSEIRSVCPFNCKYENPRSNKQPVLLY
jgi:hypothetical protein